LKINKDGCTNDCYNENNGSYRSFDNTKCVRSCFADDNGRVVHVSGVYCTESCLGDEFKDLEYKCHKCRGYRPELNNCS